MPPFFFRPDEKIDTEAYYKVLRYTVLPWFKKNYPTGNYVWQQDGAPSHMAAKNQKFCKDNRPFLAEELLATVIPGSKSAGFFLTNRTPHLNLDSLKATIIKEWDNYPEKHIINACKRFGPPRSRREGQWRPY
ncbi:Uncharacterized protein FKW44_007505 [Caligus rogercresseyi]|uniref:Transposable element Tc3 transposase n=1 Tax=Caligus rogercresseyi TaxID=217165 RepID=A0A7T8KET7_CALRO|nr:Uncharacterized protein FKW44_007505 [Caligus rogercresseyi]